VELEPSFDRSIVLIVRELTLGASSALVPIAVPKITEISVKLAMRTFLDIMDTYDNGDRKGTYIIAFGRSSVCAWGDILGKYAENNQIDSKLTAI
jgi:hypothetical protein